MKRSTWISVVLATALMLVAVVALTPGSSAAASVTLSPATGAGATKVVAAGTGWTPGQTIQARWDDTAMTLLGTAPVDAVGSFMLTFYIPAEAAASVHQVAFIQYTAGCAGTALKVPFSVTWGGPTATATSPVTATATMTSTATATESTTATATVDPSATATGTVTETATSTATTAAATATATQTATVCPTATTTPTRTPTKVGFPPSGSGGLLDSDTDGGNTTLSLTLGAIALTAAVGVSGFMVLRRRPR